MDNREAVMKVLHAANDFVGLGSLYSASGLSQTLFFETLSGLCADGFVVDCYEVERRHAYAYKAASLPHAVGDLFAA